MAVFVVSKFMLLESRFHFEDCCQAEFCATPHFEMRYSKFQPVPPPSRRLPASRLFQGLIIDIVLLKF